MIHAVSRGVRTVAGRLARVAAWVRGLPRGPAVWVMGGLLVLAMVQRPGVVTPDGGFDPAEPGATLRRALHLWDPGTGGGVTTDGQWRYLFPMGPFFLGTDALGIEPWVAQRLWSGLLLCMAFGGALILARALNLGSEPARFVGALGYAFAPGTLANLGADSVTVLPAAMLPWVLIPLVRPIPLLRAVGLSGLAVVCAGMGATWRSVEAGLWLPLMVGVMVVVARVRWSRIPAVVLVVALAAPVWLGQSRPASEKIGIPSEAVAWLRAADRDARTLTLPAGAEIPLWGHRRVVETVEELLGSGRGSAALADFLARAGYRFLLLRNDTSPLIMAGLTDSPWMIRAAELGGATIYAVQRPVARVNLVPNADAVTVSGGPESLLPLLDTQLLGRDNPAILAGDGGAPERTEWLITDGQREPEQGASHRTVSEFRGVRAVRASTGDDPFAAIDGDPLTAWRPKTTPGQWLEVEFDVPRSIEQVAVRLAGNENAMVKVITETGSVAAQVAQGPEPGVISTPAGLTNTVRVMVDAGIAELTLPGVSAQRALRVPRDSVPMPGQRVSYAFTRGSQPRYACFADGDKQRCDPGLARLGDEPGGLHRLFSTSEAGNFWLSGTVLPAVGGKNPVTVEGFTVDGSSQLAGDPAAGAYSAVDGDPGTTWIPDGTDTNPTLTISWPGRREINGLTILTDPKSGATRPAEIKITTPAGEWAGDLEDGRADFELTTDRVEITIKPGTGISEVQFSGVDDLAPMLAPETRFAVPCGQGPRIAIDGFAYDTAVSGSLADLNRHQPLLLRICGDLLRGVDLAAGDHELRTDRSESFVIQDLWLASSTLPREQPNYRPLTVQTWGVTHRSLEIGPGPASVLSVPENANPGWEARLDGQRLASVTVDGWQQAWLVPAGSGGLVRLDFTPDDNYRRNVRVGTIGVLALLVLLVVPRRRNGLVSAPDPTTTSVHWSGDDGSIGELRQGPPGLDPPR
jgi:arabinofuranan 3-O-arabinosyltransferase